MRNFGAPSPANGLKGAGMVSAIGSEAFVQQILPRDGVGQGVATADDIGTNRFRRTGREEASFVDPSSFFDQYKWPIIGGLTLLVSGGAYYFFFVRK